MNANETGYDRKRRQLPRELIEGLKLLNLLNSTFPPTSRYRLWLFSERSFRLVADEIALDGKEFALNYTLPSAKKTFLRVVTLVEEPFVKARGRSFEGHCIELLRGFAEAAGFEYEVRAVEDGFYGTYDAKRDEWSGLIGSLVRNESDLIVASLTVSAERARYVRFLPSFVEIGIRFAYRPQSESGNEYDAFAFLHPFTFGLYAAIGCGVLLVALMLNFISRVSPHGNRGHFYHFHSDWEQKKLQHLKEEAERGMGINNALYFTWAALFWQSPDTLPRAFSQRSLAVGWYLASVIFISHYTANMVGVLSRHHRPLVVTAIRSTTELLLRDDFTYGTVTDSAVEMSLRASSVPLGEEEGGGDTTVPSYAAGLRRVMAGNFALFWDSLSLQHAERESRCELVSVPTDELGGMEYAFALNRHSPHLERLVAQFARLKQRGFVRALNNKYRLGVDALCLSRLQRQETEVHRLDLADLAGVFYVTGGAMLTGCLVLLIEWFCAAYNDVHRTDRPFPPDTIREALRRRFNRVWGDALENWLPTHGKFKRRFRQRLLFPQEAIDGADRAIESRLSFASDHPQKPRAMKRSRPEWFYDSDEEVFDESKDKRVRRSSSV